jgi:hypothetical protein
VAGGGGSFAAPAAASLVASIAGSGDGSVIIEALDAQPAPPPVAVPALPGMAVVLLSALMLLAGIGRRRRLRV